MPRLSLGLGIQAIRKVSGGGTAPFSPADLSGLSLWLKADAGVTTGSGTAFISSIVITGAGSTTSNGTYTRTTGWTTTFYKTGGNYISYGYNATAESDVWAIYDATLGYTTYYAGDEGTISAWVIDGGAANAPSSTSSNTTPTVVTTWADQSGSGNNFSGTGAQYSANSLNGKPVLYFNGVDSYLTSPSTLLNNFSAITIIAVWKIVAGQSNKGIFGTADYSDIEIVANPNLEVRIRNGNYEDTFITTGFTNLGSYTLSYLDAQNQDGLAYKNGSLVSGTNGSGVEMPLGTGISYDLGRYAYPNFSTLYSEMYLAEFIIYNKRLNSTERQQVQTYLNTKYAIY
jgi:hypothetical protein